MKTHFRSFIFIFVIIALWSFTTLEAQTKRLLLQATNTDISAETMTQSVKVLNSRLLTYGLKTSLQVNFDKARISVDLPEDINKADVVQLLTNEGNFGFYETITLSEITAHSKNVNSDLEFDFQVSSSDSGIECSSSKDQKIQEKILNYFKQNNLAGNVKLLWSQINSNSQTCLYILKTDNEGNPVLGRHDIETINSVKDQNAESFNIEIKFKPESAKTWDDLTEKNLNKPIAIVIGDMVFYTPVVKTTMKNGMCEITGNLTEKETNFFLALVNSGPLPTAFTVK
jgi:preprotein translocase subunit SecD